MRLHGAAERRLARAATQFFREQGARILQRLRGHGTITPVDVANAIDWKAENARFLRTVIRPQLLATMATGATIALQILPPKSLPRPRTKAKSDKDKIKPTLPFEELPDDIKGTILDTLDEQLKQPYWERVQEDQREAIQGAIRDALGEGTFGESELSSAIRDVTDGDVSRDRGARIARTETTGALNAGHAAAMQSLEESGDSTGRTWIAVDDKDTRETHRELNGVTVGVGEDFEVGDGHAPYPGFHGLPPEERINCRCTIVAAGVGEGESGNEQGSADADEVRDRR
jgi:hypothetical protein